MKTYIFSYKKKSLHIIHFFLTRKDLDACFYDRWKSADNRHKNKEKPAQNPDSYQNKPIKDDKPHTDFNTKENQVEIC